MSLDKFEQLKELIRSYGSCLVAYSGGVDSAFLAVVAHQVLGEKSLAALADTPSLPRREFQEAVSLAKQFGFALRIVRPREFENSNYVSNPQNRCYYCKHELFSELGPVAQKENLAVMLYGENASDIGDYRPGAQAAGEFKARAPLKEVGLTKPEIRVFSRQLGLPTAEKPQMACLSSRIPYGETVTPAKLGMIEEAEYVLRDMGFKEVRVRHHELSSISGKVHLARIEMSPTEVPNLLREDAWLRVGAALKKLGYGNVTLDLEGYRRGSLNDVLSKPIPSFLKR